ncbi:MAG: dihydroneopterin aldolase [Tenacibaculum sp.]
MGIIRLNNIRLYTNHGCLVEESEIGSEYKVDIEVMANLSKSAQTDQLADTVNYVYLNTIVEQEMAVRSKLLEHVAKRIVDRILKEISLVDKVQVSVAKINPPIGGSVEQVEVVLNEIRKNSD